MGFRKHHLIEWLQLEQGVTHLAFGGLFPGKRR
jgi:hypothetical protein